MTINNLLQFVSERSAKYISGLHDSKVFPSSRALAALTRLDEPLPEKPTASQAVIELLDDVGSAATVLTTGGRFFGFVTGGSLPAALAANWLAGAWDQNAGLRVSSPIASVLEQVALRWLRDVLSLPPGAGGGFVSGATMANFTALAAARHAILQKKGWNVEANGLFAAPPVTVVVGDEVHVSVLKALSLLGFGSERVIRVPVEGQGCIRVDALPEMTDSTIVCIQAGNVNTGAFDPAPEICAAAKRSGAWVHVDGAFGLWAAAAPNYAHLAAGFEGADSWAIDAHKWLNVPYDSGMAFCREPAHLHGAMATHAAYLSGSEQPEPHHYVPEMSRRARGIEVWAALRSLGRTGLSDLIERTCKYARRFAGGLADAGYRVLNDVVINQVLVAFGDADTTRRVIDEVQADGTCWCGATQWQGHTAMRISISCWATTESDVERSLEAILRIAKKETGRVQRMV